MKKLLSLLTVFLISQNLFVFGAVKEIESIISGVTVFMNGAQKHLRTTINVWGDTCGAVVIAKSEGEKLKV